MRLAAETWAPEYGSAVDSEQLEETSADADVGIEQAESEWAPIEPARDVEAPASLVFVDRARRADARIWVTDGDRTRPGVCAPVAAEAVRCEPTTARVVASTVFRGVHAEGSRAAGPDWWIQAEPLADSSSNRSAETKYSAETNQLKKSG